MPEESHTRVDQYVRRLKNQRWAAPVIALALVVIALGTFTDSLKKLSDFLQGIHDPKAAQLRQTAGELHTTLSELYLKHKGHPVMQMSFDAFRKQDSTIPLRFFELYRDLGIPEPEINKVERVYEFEDYLLVNYGIPGEDPQALFPAISFLTVCLGPQRTSAIEDLEFRPSRESNSDDISYRLYSAALVSHPTTKAGDYARELMSTWVKNYKRHKPFVEYLSSIEWDLKYLPPQLFRAQDSSLAAAFNPIFRRITVETPQVPQKGPYFAHERIEFLLTELEKLAR